MYLPAMALLQKKCAPREKGGKPLPPEQVHEFLREIPGWQLLNNRALRREFILKDFMEAVRLIREIARVAEAEDHHPDLHLTGYRRLAIELSTHSIGGLSENDFILAAKINALPREEKKA
jgi:4a-hydroxytetrahydrobiopterin dehydratase